MRIAPDVRRGLLADNPASLSSWPETHMTPLIKRTVAAALLLGVMPMSLQAEPLKYPEARRVDVVDDYFGHAVADPYRWLEDTDSAETHAWVKAQNDLALPFLAALPEHQAIQQRLTELWNYERYDEVQRHAGRYFYRRNDGLQNQSVLVVESADGKPKVLLDPNTLAADGTVALTQYEVSPDARWVAYSTAAAGSDWNEIRVRGVADGKDSAEVLSGVKFSGISWAGDSQGFFYSRYPQADDPDAPGTFDTLSHQRLYYHRVGQPQAKDTMVFSVEAEPRWGYGGEVTDDGRYLIISIWQGSSDNVRVYVKDLGEGEAPKLDGPVLKLVDDFNASYGLIGNVGSRLFFTTTLDAGRGKVVAVDLKDPQQWQTLIPESGDTLTAVAHVGDELVAEYMHDATSLLQRFGLDGKPQGRIALPGLGSVTQLYGKPGEAELLFSFAAYTQPETPYRLDLADKEAAAPFKTVKLSFDPSDYVTEQVFYPSKDGTKIPMFISYKRGLKRDGSARAHLYGYGGFNISLTPNFSVPNLVWMERGGVYAVANLRGGGEYGEAWHEAGTQQNKQNVFDDFAWAAKYLIQEKWTASEHLVISGRSNGGLLIGATINQHPELFAAALPGVGVMDMLRYHRFTIGWAWAGDYGTSETEAGFDTLIRYSPLHNIKPGTAYPAVLVTTADHDDRVVPGHSFKYAATLQPAQAADKPVLIRIDVKAGHGSGKPVSMLIEEEADKLAFMTQYTAR